MKTLASLANIGTLGAKDSKSFSPGQVPNLVLWIDANTGVYNDAGVTLATNGQTVQQWNDRSGVANNFTQATAGSKPIFNTGYQNSRPAVVFDGVDDFMINATAAASAAKTLFFCGKAVAALGGVRRFCSYNDSSASLFDDATQYAYYSTQAAAILDIFGTVTDPTVINVRHNSTSNADTFWNNTLITSAFDPSDGYATDVGFSLGAENNSGTNPSNVAIFEILVYNRALSLVEISSVNKYLGTKYNITMN